jgi:hypothetical protein
MRKLLMPTLGEMSAPNPQVRDEFRDLLPAAPVKAPTAHAPLLRPTAPAPTFQAPNLSALRARSQPPGLICLINTNITDN